MVIVIFLLPWRASAQEDPVAEAFDDKDNILYASETDASVDPEPSAMTEDVALPDESGVRQVTILGGKRIARITLRCEIPFCEDEENRDKLVRSTGLKVGDELSIGKISQAVKILREIGYFSHVDVLWEQVGDGVGIIFETTGHVMIRKLKFDNKSSLFDGEIRKRFILRPGSALYPRSALLRGKNPYEMSQEELIEIALGDQEQSIVNQLIKEGFPDAEVKVTPEPVNRYEADLNIYVRSNRGYKPGKLYLKGNKLFDYNGIDEIFRSYFGYFDYITKEKIDKAADEILRTYREKGYVRTKLSYVTRENKKMHAVDVFMLIKESERWQIQFEGNEALSASELRKSMPGFESGNLDATECESTAEALRNRYLSAGYYNAKVECELLNPTPSSPGIVLFRINEGERIEIANIIFDGAGYFSYRELMNAIGSKAYSAFGSGAYPQRILIADDASKIIELYNNHGFLSADVSSWSLVPTGEEGRVTLTFVIHEGKQSKWVRQRLFLTDREDSPEIRAEKLRVLAELRLEDTDYFSDFGRQGAQAKLSKQLREKGYAAVRIESFCKDANGDDPIASDSCDLAALPLSCFPDDPGELCRLRQTPFGAAESCDRNYAHEYNDPNQPPCVLKGLDAPEIEVRYGIRLGPKYVTGDVFIQGNAHTSDWVIRNDLPFRRGEVFDYNAMIDARSYLRNRTIFQRANVAPVGLDENSLKTHTQPEVELPIVVSVEEGLRRWIDFAVGISYVSYEWLFTSETEYVEANLFGWGWDWRFLIMPELRFFNSRGDWLLTKAFNQNLFMLSTLRIPISPAKGVSLIAQLFYDLRYIPATDKEELGGSVELQWKINNRFFTALNFEAKLSGTHYPVLGGVDEKSYHFCYPVTLFQTCPFSDRTHTYSLSPRVFYDGRDNPINPTKGFYTEGRIKFAYSDAVKFYLKPEVRVSYVFSFFKHFSIALMSRFGFAWLKSNEALPWVDRFFLGGLNMRGFPENALGKRRIDIDNPTSASRSANGGETMLNLGAEFRFPVWKSLGIFSVVFVDAGSLLPHQPSRYGGKDFAETLFKDEMRYTAGVGLRWFIVENIPPIVIDYGFVLNRKRGEAPGMLSLNIGYTF